MSLLRQTMQILKRQCGEYWTQLLPFGCLEIKPTFHLPAFTLQALPHFAAWSAEVHDNEFEHLRLFIFADWRQIPEQAEHTGEKLLTFKKQQRRSSEFSLFQNISNVFFSPPPPFFFLAFSRSLKSVLALRSLKGQLLVVGGTRFFSFDCVLSAQSFCCLFQQAAEFLCDSTFSTTWDLMK